MDTNNDFLFIMDDELSDSQDKARLRDTITVNTDSNRNITSINTNSKDTIKYIFDKLFFQDMFARRINELGIKINYIKSINDDLLFLMDVMSKTFQRITDRYFVNILEHYRPGISKQTFTLTKNVDMNSTVAEIASTMFETTQIDSNGLLKEITNVNKLFEILSLDTEKIHSLTADEKILRHSFGEISDIGIFSYLYTSMARKTQTCFITHQISKSKIISNWESKDLRSVKQHNLLNKNHKIMVLDYVIDGDPNTRVDKALFYVDIVLHKYVQGRMSDFNLTIRLILPIEVLEFIKCNTLEELKEEYRLFSKTDQTSFNQYSIIVCEIGVIIKYLCLLYYLSDTLFDTYDNNMNQNCV